MSRTSIDWELADAACSAWVEADPADLASPVLKNVGKAYLVLKDRYQKSKQPTGEVGTTIEWVRIE